MARQFASGVNRNYWSGTTVSNNTANAWNTNLSNGNTNNNTKLTNQNYIRCVRSGNEFYADVPNYILFMAQFSHLPIYIKTYEFIKLVYRIVKQFRKEYKYTFGVELEQIIWQILDNIIIANSSLNVYKLEEINKISMLFDRFKIRFRCAYELGLISSKKFGIAQKEMEEIGRMIGGWQKWADGQPVKLHK